MTVHVDVAVVGAGIVGLAHAWMASRRGLRVALLERDAAAQAASVRNFGMIWPVGQPQGDLHAIALESRGFWLELQARGAVDLEDCGSIHLAHRPDELAVLEEFCGLGSHPVGMLTAEEVLRRSPLANPDQLLGGMFSGTELRVDPRVASARIARWLAADAGVQCHFETAVTGIDGRILMAADGRRWSAERIVICSGSDLRTLFPGILGGSPLRLCKLQMLRSAAQPDVPPATPHLASGLTLRHYTSFAACPSLKALKDRIASETPELDRYGIHVMASPFPGGEVVLGDSHEYGGEVTPFDKGEIDDLIVRELRKVIRLRDWRMRERWHGIYAKHPTQPVLEATAGEGVHVFVGPGGAGMTMSFGLANRAWRRWKGDSL